MHVKESSVCFSVGIALLVSRLSSSRTSILEKFIVPVRSKERRTPLQRSIQRSLCVDSPLVVGVSLRVVDHRPHACTRVRPLSTSTRFFSHLPLIPLFPPSPNYILLLDEATTITWKHPLDSSYRIVNYKLPPLSTRSFLNEAITRLDFLLSPTSRPTLLVSPTSCNLIRQYLGAYE